MNERHSPANLLANAAEMLRDHRKYHSSVQIESFILEAHSRGTWWGLYTQALREISGRVRNIRRSLIELRKKALEIDDVGTQPDRELCELDMQGIRDGVLDTYRELQLFIMHAQYARMQVEKARGIPPGGEIDEDLRHELEMEAWCAEVRRRATLESVVGGRPGRATMELVFALPKDERDAALAELKSGEFHFSKLDLPRLPLERLARVRPTMYELEAAVQEAEMELLKC